MSTPKDSASVLPPSSTDTSATQVPEAITPAPTDANTPVDLQAQSSTTDSTPPTAQPPLQAPVAPATPATTSQDAANFAAIPTSIPADPQAAAASAQAAAAAAVQAASAATQAAAQAQAVAKAAVAAAHAATQSAESSEIENDNAEGANTPDPESTTGSNEDIVQAAMVNGDLMQASTAAAAAAATASTPTAPEQMQMQAAAAAANLSQQATASDFAVSGLDYSNDTADTPPAADIGTVQGTSNSAAPTADTDSAQDSEALQFIPDNNVPFTPDNDDEHLILHGNPASRGIAVGRISFLQRSAPAASKQHIDDVEAELNRFEAARVEAIAQLGKLYEMTVEKLGEQNAVVFQIHQMMLDDPEYVDAIRTTIKDEQANAEYAVDATGQRFSDMFSHMDNDYMQGRAADVLDVSHRLCDILHQHAGVSSHHNLVQANEPIILATDDLAPSETVQLDQNLVRGILTSEGSSRSHTVIFARTLGLPAVINIGNQLNKDLEGKLAIVDGGAGVVIIDPDEKTLSIYAERKRTEDALRARLEQFRGKETRTLSGRRIQLFANIGAVSDLDIVKTSDAEGIGLFRSEYIYLSSSDFPTEETQFNIYKETLAAMEGKKVVIRTLDIGADKTADYFMLKPEENPAMGMRAVRICLSRPEIFKTQLRALYRASVYGTLAIMFPMISSVEEVKECLRICKEVQDELTNEGKPFSDHVELGIMIETPASAIISDLLAEYVDFFSIGTNDLTQFTLAVDRQNAEVGRFLNPYHRAVIRLIEITVKNAHKNGIWVGVCGELAADEGFTHELVRIGVDEISVVPSSILMLRARISTLG